MNTTRFKANYRYNPEHEEKKSFDEFVASTPDDILEEVFDVKNADNILLYRKPVMWKMIRFADELRKQREDYWKGPEWKADESDSGCFYCTNGDVYDFDLPSFKTVKIGRCVCKGGSAKPSQFVIDIATAMKDKGDRCDCVKAASLPPYLRFIGKLTASVVSTHFENDEDRESWNHQTIETIINRYGGI